MAAWSALRRAVPLESWSTPNALHRSCSAPACPSPCAGRALAPRPSGSGSSFSPGPRARARCVVPHKRVRSAYTDGNAVPDLDQRALAAGRDDTRRFTDLLHVFDGKMQQCLPVNALIPAGP